MEIGLTTAQFTKLCYNSSMKKTIQWFITSSADPENVSLFIKSLATFAILFGIDTTIVNDAGGYIGNFIVGLGMIASALSGLWGIGRKIQLGKWSANNLSTM